jgi:microcystin-dependent protein
MDEGPGEPIGQERYVMAEPFLGMIAQFGFAFAPAGWALCRGQLLPIQQNNALFALLGTTYGGNGETTFQLPDLQSRVAVGQGEGFGLSRYVIGEIGGAERVTLLLSNLPPHTHAATFSSTSTLNASTVKAGGSTPAAGSILGRATDGATASQPQIYCPAGTSATIALGGLNVAGTVTVGATGNGAPVATLPPFLAINYSIALSGIFPQSS